MATLYKVGTATNLASNTAWANASGGTSGAGVPSDVVADVANFDASSGTITGLTGLFTANNVRFTGSGTAIAYGTNTLTLGSGGLTFLPTNGRQFVVSGAVDVGARDQTWALYNSASASSVQFNSPSTLVGSATITLTHNAASSPTPGTGYVYILGSQTSYTGRLVLSANTGLAVGGAALTKCDVQVTGTGTSIWADVATGVSLGAADKTLTLDADASIGYTGRALTIASTIALGSASRNITLPGNVTFGAFTGSGSLTLTGSGGTRTVGFTQSSPLFTGTVTIPSTVNLQVGTTNGAGASGNFFPAATNFTLNGYATILMGSTAAYTIPKLSGSGTYFLSQSSTATMAANGVTFNDLSDFAGTMVLWGNQYISNNRAHVAIKRFPTSAATLQFDSGAGGNTSTLQGTITIPSDAVATTTPVKIAWSAYTANGLSTWLTAIYANQLAEAMEFTGTVTRLDSVATPLTLTLGGSSSADNKISGVISQTAAGAALGITKVDGGKWVLSNANTHTGNTRPQAGTLEIANSLALQNSALHLESTDTGTVTFTGAAATAATVGGLTQTTAARNWQIPAGMTTLTLNTGSNIHYGGILSGSGSQTIVKTGNNVTGQYFSGANDFGGKLQIDKGCIYVGNNGTTGSFNNVTEINLASVDASNYGRIFYYRTAAITHPATAVVKGSGIAIFGNDNTGTVTVADGALKDFTGTLYFGQSGGITTAESVPTSLYQLNSTAGTGTGAWTKTGAKVTVTAGGNHIGAWNINAGEVAVNGAVTAATGAITVAAGAKLTGTGAISKPVSISAGSTGNVFVQGGAATLNVSGTATTTGTTTGAVTVNSGGTYTSNGAIGALTVASGGTAAINGNTAAMSITGTGVTLSAGTSTGNLTLGATGGTKTAITLPAGRTITTSQFFTNTAATATDVAVYQEGATVSATAGSTSYSYLNNGAASGGYSYWRLTSGTLGTATWLEMGNGGTSNGVNAVLEARGTGTLTGHWGIGWNNPGDQAAHFETTAQTTGRVQVGFGSSAATRVGWTIDNISFSTAGVEYLMPSSVNNQANIAVKGAGGALNAAVVSGTGTGTLSLVDGATLSFTGTQPASWPIYQFGTGNKLAAPTGGSAIMAAVIAGGTTADGVTAITIPAGSEGAGYIGPPVVRITGGGGTGAVARAEWDKTTQTLTGITVISPGTGYTTTPTVTLAGGGYTTLASATAAVGSVTVQNTVEKTGAGTLALTAANTYTGTTTVSAGTLNIGNNTLTGTLGPATTGSYGSSNAVLNGGTLGFFRNESLTYGGTISGTGGISKPATTSTTAIATLAGDNSFTGAISVANGALRTTHVNGFGSAAATANITVTAGAAEFDAGIGTTITSARGFSIAGAGVTGGALRASSGSVTLSGTGALTAAATVDAGTAAALTLNGAISGAFALTKGSGAGTVSLGGVNTFSGAVAVNAGTLAYRWAANGGSNSSLGSGSAAISLANNTTLEYYGVVPGSTNRQVSSAGTASTDVTITLSSTGAAPITYTAAPAITRPGTAGVTKRLVLSGTSVNANKLDAVLADPAAGTGNYAIAKQGTGKWVLSQDNTFTVPVDIEAGTLVAASETAARRFGTGNLVRVFNGARIQTLAGVNQKGQHTYTNLTFLSGGRIRIGGTLTTGAIQVNGDLTISGAVTWSLTDLLYKTPGTYDLLVFASGSLVGGSATLANVTISLPAAWGRTASNLRYDTSGTYPTIKIDIA